MQGVTAQFCMKKFWTCEHRMSMLFWVSRPFSGLRPIMLSLTTIGQDFDRLWTPTVGAGLNYVESLGISPIWTATRQTKILISNWRDHTTARLSNPQWSRTTFWSWPVVAAATCLLPSTGGHRWPEMQLSPMRSGFRSAVVLSVLDFMMWDRVAMGLL